MKTRKPNVSTRCPAEAYNKASGERIVEFSNGESTEGRYAGGLISLRNNNPDGHKCLVEVYRADKGVAVRCDPDLIDLSEVDALRYVERIAPNAVPQPFRDLLTLAKGLDAFQGDYRMNAVVRACEAILESQANG